MRNKKCICEWCGEGFITKMSYLGKFCCNGITLCKNCHKDFHDKNGYSGFSPEDLVEFIDE